MGGYDSAQLLLFAQLLDPALLIPTLTLIGALLLAAVIIAFVRRWQQTQRRPLHPSASDQLAEFRTLYEQGRITEEEFKRLRSVLGEEIRKEIALPGPAPTTPPSTQAIQPAPNEPPPPPAPPPPSDGIKPA